MNNYERTKKSTVQSDSHSIARVVRASGQTEGCTQAQARTSAAGYRRLICENRAREEKIA